ncbi:MAG: S41 family peptidase [Oscillospiraceae bacterium]|nr:S41 family peptidase [Oscillospiraceae bacterium]
MNKKISLSAALVLVCFAVLLTFMMTYVNTYNNFNKKLASAGIGDRVALKLAELEKMVEIHYIGEIDHQKVLDGIARGYVMGLGDRYAYYYDAGEYAQYQLGNQGKLVGIGVEVLYSQEMGGVIEVAFVYPDSPAREGGMIEGDYIYMVEDELVSELGYYEAIEKVRGEIGTTVNLTVLRGEPENFEELKLVFTRGEVKTQSVKSRMINSKTGYVKIKEFNQETPNEFKNAMDELESSGAEKYIFDLRYNPGGDLMGVTQTLDYLLPEGPIIRYTYKNNSEFEVLYSDAEEIVAPMAVLMNESTASAAELFCAALQDYEKAVLIGTKTYGKGTMQGIYPLGDKITAIKISNAKYYPPFSDCYDGIGVFPHMEVFLPEELLREKNFEKITDEEDTQLQAAVKALE